METSESASERRYAGRHRITDHAAPSLAGYEVLEPIGQGGSGTVWSALTGSGETVAIKVVPAVDAADALVELAVLSRISDPHLVRLHEATELPGGEVALVLDHLAGGTLGAAVRARGHLAPGEAVTVLSPVSSTLGRLHTMGVVHGDVSPDNVLLDLDGCPFLADLGVARIVGDQQGDVRGTEGFVAPEVTLGAMPTAAADVFGLGALAWFVLTGEAPGPVGLRGRLSDRLPELPHGLVGAVEGALASRPEDRPDVDALAMAIFESAQPQSLVLVTGDDDVSLMTRRIRAAARSTAQGGAEDVGPGRRGRGGEPGRRRELLSLRTGQAGRSLLRGVRVVAPFLVVAGVITGVAFGVLAWAGGGEDARAATPSSSVRPVAASAAQKAAGSAAGSPATGDARSRADAPRSDPMGLVRALAQARAQAWSSGVAARLLEVDASGSPALARDTEVLGGVQRAQQRYVGLTFHVREATFVGESEGVATIRARIDTGAHVVRGPSGDVKQSASSPAPVLLDLVRGDSGWRVRDVRAL